MLKPTNLSILKSSKFSIDFIDYQNMTLNALNKKLLKWNNYYIKFYGMDKYTTKHYFKKQVNSESDFIWTQYLFYIKINLLVIKIFYEKRKVDCEIFNKRKHNDYLKH